MTIQGDLDDIGVGDQLRVLNGAGSGDHGEVWIVTESTRKGVNQFRVEKWFITLDVDHMGGFPDLRGRLGNAVGSRRMIGTGGHKTGTEGITELGDALVVSCHQQFVKFPASAGSFNDMLQEWFAEEGVEGLSGEAGGGPAGRDDANNASLVVDRNPPCAVSEG